MKHGICECKHFKEISSRADSITLLYILYKSCTDLTCYCNVFTFQNCEIVLLLLFLDKLKECCLFIFAVLYYREYQLLPCAVTWVSLMRDAQFRNL